MSEYECMYMVYPKVYNALVNSVDPNSPQLAQIRQLNSNIHQGKSATVINSDNAQPGNSVTNRPNRPWPAPPPGMVNKSGNDEDDAVPGQLQTAQPPPPPQPMMYPPPMMMPNQPQVGEGYAAAGSRPVETSITMPNTDPSTSTTASTSSGLSATNNVDRIQGGGGKRSGKRKRNAVAYDTDPDINQQVPPPIPKKKRVRFADPDALNDFPSAKLGGSIAGGNVDDGRFTAEKRAADRTKNGWSKSKNAKNIDLFSSRWIDSTKESNHFRRQQHYSPPAKDGLSSDEAKERIDEVVLRVKDRTGKSHLKTSADDISKILEEVDQAANNEQGEDDRIALAVEAVLAREVKVRQWDVEPGWQRKNNKKKKTASSMEARVGILTGRVAASGGKRKQTRVASTDKDFVYF